MCHTRRFVSWSICVSAYSIASLVIVYIAPHFQQSSFLSSISLVAIRNLGMCPILLHNMYSSVQQH